MLVTEINATLRDMADPSKAPDMQKYMKSQMPYLGAQKSRLTQVVRRMTKSAKLDREERLAVASELWEQAQYRE